MDRCCPIGGQCCGGNRTYLDHMRGIGTNVGYGLQGVVQRGNGVTVPVVAISMRMAARTSPVARSARTVVQVEDVVKRGKSFLRMDDCNSAYEYRC